MSNLLIKENALVVDDEPMIRHLVSRIFKENNFNVFEGKNGVEAITQFISTRPSLIVIDMRMPVMDGCSAASIIRNIYSEKQVSIILFTSEKKEIIAGNSVCKSVNIVIDKNNVSELRELVRTTGKDNLKSE